MGFKLKNVLKSVGNVALGPVGLVGGLLGGGGKSQGGGGAPAFNQQQTPTPDFASQRRKLSDILGDTSFTYSDAPVGPGIEDNTAAYQAALDSGEAARRREETAATDNILEGLQSRGIARSGIALKDVVSQVLGPSAERANSLAAQFGLAQAQDRSNVLGQQREAANALNQAKLGGRLSSILGYDTGNTNLAISQLDADNAMKRLGQEQAFNANQASSDRRASRQNAVVGGLSGILGGFLGLCFRPDTLIEMGDGSTKAIRDVELGDMTRGGIVVSVRRSFTSEMKRYKDVFVTGSHAVLEDGTWKRVVDSKQAEPVSGYQPVISLITSKHRIYSHGITFADEQETDKPLWTDPQTSLDILNQSRPESAA